MELTHDRVRRHFTLLRELTFRIVGGRFDLSLKAFHHALEKCLLIEVFAREGLRMDDVPREISQHNSPCKRVFPDAGAQADVLSLLGNPDAQKLEGSGVALCNRRGLKILGGRHG